VKRLAGSFGYRVYGLLLNTNVEIPGLQSCMTAGEEGADIAVTMGAFPEEIAGIIDSPAKRYYHEAGYNNTDPPHLIVNTLADGKYFHFRYGVGVQFVCDRQATVVWGWWWEHLSLTDASLYLLGPIIGFLLRLRGITCLHASSVIVDGLALAIAGPSGTGKSSLAAAFAAAGYPILTDDVLALAFDQELLYASPGYARLRLLPHSFQNIAGLPENLPALAPNWDKCYLDLTAAPYSFKYEAVPLGVVYLLDWEHTNRATPEIVPLKPATAVPYLAANTYRNELLDSSMRTEEFKFLSRVASKIPVRKVQPLDDILELLGLIELIQNDFRTYRSP